jgi:hypothetical protein
MTDDAKLLSELLSRCWPFGLVLLAFGVLMVGNYWKAKHRPRASRHPS